MGIIEQIQKDALDRSVPVSTLLRKVKLAAAKLGLPKVEGWVDKELKGYDPQDDIPTYREVHGYAVAQGGLPGWMPIMFEDAKAAEKFSIAPIGQSIPGIEGQIQTNPGAYLIFPYSPKLKAALNKVNRGRIANCGISFHASSLIPIVEAARTLVLEWAIDMEKAGISGSDISFSNEERARASAAPTAIHIGSIGNFTGNLGVGNSAGDITFSPLQIDRVRDLVNQIKTHSATLRHEGMDEAKLLQRVRQIEAELAKTTPDVSFLQQLLNGLKVAVATTAQGLVSSGLLSMINQILGTGVPGLAQG